MGFGALEIEKFSLDFFFIVDRMVASSDVTEDSFVLHVERGAVPIPNMYTFMGLTCVLFDVWPFEVSRPERAGPSSTC